MCMCLCDVEKQNVHKESKNEMKEGKKKGGGEGRQERN